MTIEGKAEQLRQLVRNGKTRRGVSPATKSTNSCPLAMKQNQLDDILSELAGNGFEVPEEPRAERGEQFSEDESLNENELRELSEEAGDDPAVQMYIREVLTLPHLTHERAR